MTSSNVDTIISQSMVSVGSVKGWIVNDVTHNLIIFDVQSTLVTLLLIMVLKYIAPKERDGESNRECIIENPSNSFKLLRDINFREQSRH